MRTTASKYKINEGQKLVSILTIIAATSIVAPSKSRYLIIKFKNFINKKLARPAERRSERGEQR